MVAICLVPNYLPIHQLIYLTIIPHLCPIPCRNFLLSLPIASCLWILHQLLLFLFHSYVCPLPHSLSPILVEFGPVYDYIPLSLCTSAIPPTRQASCSAFNLSKCEMSACLPLQASRQCQSIFLLSNRCFPAKKNFPFYLQTLFASFLHISRSLSLFPAHQQLPAFKSTDTFF